MHNPSRRAVVVGQVMVIYHRILVYGVDYLIRMLVIVGSEVEVTALT